MPKAIAIRRVSTKDQAENNHSLQQQDSSVQNMASVLNAPVVKDWGMAVSSKKGNNLKRKDLQEALAYCRYNKGVRYLLIDKVSRFMRELKMIFYYMVEFEKLGVKVIFCDPSQQRYNTDTAEAMYEIARKAYEAEAENEERAATSRTKMQERVRLGYYPFYPRQGYMKGAEPGLHMPDPARFKLLQHALQCVAAQEMTPKEAQLWLFDNGYRTPKGNRKLDMNHFHSILLDPYYAGLLRIKNWPEARGLHQPMITMQEYALNVSIISGRKIRRRNKTNPKFPLNLSFHEPCDSEKAKVTGINHSNGKGWRRDEYLCRKCHKRVPSNHVHQSWDDTLERLKLRGDAVEGLMEALEESWNRQESYRVERITQLRQRREELESQKQNLIALMASEPDLLEDCKANLRQVKARIERVDGEIVDASTVDDEFIQFMRYSLNYIENLRQKWWTLPPQSQAECKRLLFNDKIFITEDAKVYTPEISDIYTLLQAKSDPKVAKNAELVELVGTAPTSAGLSWLIVYRLRSFKNLEIRPLNDQKTVPQSPKS